MYTSMYVLLSTIIHKQDRRPCSKLNTLNSETHLSQGKNFKSYFLVISAKDTIAVQRYGLLARDLNEFLSSYPIPSKYDVILPISTQTIFDAPPGYVGLYTHSFSLANLMLPLTDFFCEVLQYFKVYISRLNPFGCAKLTTFIIMCKAYGCEPSVDLFRGAIPRIWYRFSFCLSEYGFSKDVKEPKVQPAEITTDSGESSKAGVFVVHPGSVAARIKERKCKTRGGSSRPLVKRKLACGSSSSHAIRAKTFASKDDDPILSIYDDDKGLSDYFKLKDANACHLKISAITPPAWKVNRRAREFLQVIGKMSAAMEEFDQNPAVVALREKIYLLTTDVKEHKGNLDRMMLESQKWAGYQVTLSTLESKVDSLKAKKAKLEAVEASLHREVEELKQDRKDVVLKVVPYAAMELVHSDELGRVVGTLVSSTITYGRCRVYEQVAAMKEPFDLSKAKGYRSSYKKEHT
ncbi:hypothetical protein Tco_1116531 [Tanacetum coccineum]